MKALLDIFVKLDPICDLVCRMHMMFQRIMRGTEMVKVLATKLELFGASFINSGNILQCNDLEYKRTTNCSARPIIFSEMLSGAWDILAKTSVTAENLFHTSHACFFLDHKRLTHDHNRL